MEPKIIGREEIWKGDFLLGVKVTYLDPDGKQRIWEFVERKNPNIASIVLYDNKEKEFIFVEQLRFPVGNRNVIGLVSGVCDVKGESREETVIRESCEEAGRRPQKIWLISEDCTGSAGFGNERKTTYWGTDLEIVEKKKGHEEDGIIVHSVPRSAIFLWFDEQRKKGKLIEDNVVGNIAYVLRVLEQDERMARTQERIK